MAITSKASTLARLRSLLGATACGRSEHELDALLAALEHLLEVSSQIAETPPAEAILQSVCDGIAEALAFEKVSIQLYDPATGLFSARAAVGWDGDDERLPSRRPLAQIESLLDPELEVEGCFLVPAAKARDGRAPRAWDDRRLVVPLRDPDGVLQGFIWADDPEDRLLPSRARLQALRLFANQAASALAAAAQFKALAASDARKSAILRSAPDSVITTDADWRIVEFNPAAEEALGWIASEVIGRDLVELLAPPGRREELGSLLADCLSGRQSSRLGARAEASVVRSDRRELVVELALTPVGAHYTAHLHDITRSRQIEERLSETERRYRGLVEGLPLATYINELGWPIKTIYVSPRIEEMLGYTADEWLVPDFYPTLLHPDDRERILAEVERTHGSAQPFRAEYRLVAKDGRVLWVLDETLAVYGEQGEPLYLQGYLLDVTERKEAEEAQARSDELYRLVVEKSRDAISMLDSEGRICFASPANEAILGYTQDELVGRELASLVHPDDLAAVEANLAAGGGEPLTARVRHRDGGWVTLRGFATPIGERVLTIARVVEEAELRLLRIA